MLPPSSHGECALLNCFSKMARNPKTSAGEVIGRRGGAADRQRDSQRDSGTVRPRRSDIMDVRR